MERRRERVEAVARRRVLTDPARALRDRHRRVDELRGRLAGAARVSHRRVQHRVELATTALSSLHPLARISNGRAVLGQLRERLVSTAFHRAKESRHRFAAAVGRLESLSPLAVLGRGYSLTRLASGAIVRRAAQATPGESIEILLGEGALGARVTEVRERDERHQV